MPATSVGMTKHQEGVMASLQQQTEIRDGMRIDWNVPITMDDGLVLRADIFRPVKDGNILRFRTAIPARGSAWPRSILMSPPGQAISTRTGKSSTRKNGCRAIMPACASTRAAQDARQASSIISHLARQRIFTTASNGPACSPGPTAKSDLTGSLTTGSISGTWLRCSRPTSPPCASGKALPTGTAT
jgi:hypothetical protein